MSYALKADNIHFSYGTKPVLRNLSLEIEEGEMLGIVGPNGAGKTTLVNILSGNLLPNKGHIWHDGKPLAELKPRDRAKAIAVVAQNPTVPPGFTTLEIVLMGRNPHLGILQWEGTKDVEIARRVMGLTDTVHFINRQLTSLSGGERQRVFIARALAQEAPILLLDEPTAHLDIGYQSDILKMIQAIRRQSELTVVAAMHDLTMAAQHCNRIAVLHEGTIRALGKPDDVLNQKLIRTVFGTEVTIIRHPVYQTPVVLAGEQTLPGTLNQVGER